MSIPFISPDQQRHSSRNLCLDRKSTHCLMVWGTSIFRKKEKKTEVSIDELITRVGSILSRNAGWKDTNQTYHQDQ
jgi:hypothetical protein